MPTVNLASGSGSQVSYSSGDTELRGYFAAPAGANSAPAVIVVHEWWGINDYIRRRVDMLAELGFCALAADMYGGGREGQTPDDAGALMQAVLDDPAAVPQRFGAIALVAQWSWVWPAPVLIWQRWRVFTGYWKPQLRRSLGRSKRV